MIQNMFNKLPLALMASIMLLSGCGEDEVFLNAGSTETNPGVISQDNFTLLFSDPTPKFFDTTTGQYSTVEVDVSVFIGDRNNRTLTDSHVIYFDTEWGLIGSKCTTSQGTCSVKWRSGSPDTAPTDFLNRIVAYSTGEESYTDINDNGTFDDSDVFTLATQDIPEPFIDANSNGTYDASTERIIDSNGDGVHNVADGKFNGANCTHSTLCSTTTSTTVWESGDLLLTGPPP